MADHHHSGTDHPDPGLRPLSATEKETERQAEAAQVHEEPVEQRPAPPAARAAAFAMSIALMAAGLFLAWSSWGLGVGTLARPGSGLWPFALSVALFLGGLLTLPDAVRFREVPEGSLSGVPLALALGGGLVVYALLLPRLGFFLLTPVVVLAVMRFVARSRWWVALLSAVLVTVAVYGVFTYALRVPMPLWPSF